MYTDLMHCAIMTNMGKTRVVVYSGFHYHHINIWPACINAFTTNVFETRGFSNLTASYQSVFAFTIII